jgi:hypothetical protein
MASWGTLLAIDVDSIACFPSTHEAHREGMSVSPLETRRGPEGGDRRRFQRVPPERRGQAAAAMKKCSTGLKSMQRV